MLHQPLLLLPNPHTHPPTLDKPPPTNIPPHTVPNLLQLLHNITLHLPHTVPNLQLLHSITLHLPHTVRHLHTPLTVDVTVINHPRPHSIPLLDHRHHHHHHTLRPHNFRTPIITTLRIVAPVPHTLLPIRTLTRPLCILDVHAGTLTRSPLVVSNFHLPVHILVRPFLSFLGILRILPPRRNIINALIVDIPLHPQYTIGALTILHLHCIAPALLLLDSIPLDTVPDNIVVPNGRFHV